ncbi:MAG TPA: glycosyltransferase family 2 protein [Phycisphaerae bacterium]|nr:glycosyltransferase family 2 protein [Phycisphaerales bacterium]HNO79492.1 glycosyltransferase family 2 protein [Phycisphaerae bacterium]
MATVQSNPDVSAESTAAPSLPPEVREKVYIVIPAYNEGEKVGTVIEEVRALYPNVVVVDDGSKDESAAISARAGAKVLRHAINRGQGAALQTGIDFAILQGAEFVVTFDSDGQHRIEDIPVLIAPILEGKWDISLGSRFLGGVENIKLSRKWLLRLGVLFTRIVSRVKITDTHNGLRAFSRRAAQRIQITLDRMAHASELIDQVRDCGLPYGEVPVHIRYTDYSKAKGQSSAGAFKIIFHYLFKRMTS